ncbi:SacI homology domain-containing protein [Scheffersomyces xylosifermentans]|uniref:SacI homology domain-containing protein n=1 Tax=Scheffersomyces xylosifermentans TaxID=1304137 RepID=UPI00315D9B31
MSESKEIYENDTLINTDTLPTTNQEADTYIGHEQHDATPSTEQGENDVKSGEDVASATNASDNDDDQEGDTSNDEGDNISNSVPEFNNKRIILQRFTVYNSSATMYIVGSNAKETLFRILEIGKDPNNDDALEIMEDKSYFYTRKDMIELLNGLDESIEGGIHKIAQGYGLLGLIKFTKGFYLSIITKCSQVAVLGGHFMYHIDETKLIPLDINYRRPEKYSDEERLLSIFKYLDLGKTFYFSFAYDITNSLQTNFMRNKKAATDFKYSVPPNNRSNDNFNTFEHNERFVWNNLLLKPVLENADIATYEWFQPIIHGFIDQAKISIYGKKFYITIIARRSHHFAGARFLKRGVNDRGNVANEIETEQIVSDMLTSSFHDPRFGFYNNPRYTSFVQHRGSIPLYWTQDLNRLPKPPIEINLSDPFYQSSAIHFNNLFQRYGSPVIVLNLIKTKEKIPRESKLNSHFTNCITYLNQFLPEEHKLRYHSFDMSKHSKKNLDVIAPLQKIASKSIKEIGYFHNGKSLSSTKLQKGVIRTNCIDCLDRTNAAQFIICKEALTHQLRGLSLISEDKSLDYDSDLINILTEIFHDHGDTIAVQYGGSNLVNTMDSYRRINQWSSHTRDILNSVKRIYSNSFMDSIRQEAINLFLGNYIYHPDKPKLWELQNDFYLHNEMAIDNIRIKVSYIEWFNKLYLSDSRFSFHEGEYLTSDSYWDPQSKLEPFPDSNDNWFNECYVPRKFQSLSEVFQYNMNSNARYFPSNTDNMFDYSPFDSRKPRQDDPLSSEKSAKSGESNLRYLDGCFDEVESSRTGDYWNEGHANYYNRSSIGQNYLNITNPIKIKKYFTNKMGKLGYNDSKRRQDYRGSDAHYDSSLKSDTTSEDKFFLYDNPQGVVIVPKSNESDLHLYKSQMEIPRLLSSTTAKVDYDKDPHDLKVRMNDREVYDYYSTVLTNSTSSEIWMTSYHNSGQMSYNANDLRLYSQYLGIDEDKLVSLKADDDYFT